MKRSHPTKENMERYYERKYNKRRKGGGLYQTKTKHWKKLKNKREKKYETALIPLRVLNNT